ncbi:MAG: autotransporter-associated beta strand repeat-containing protein [Chthoniobacteraceae bacterium]
MAKLPLKSILRGVLFTLSVSLLPSALATSGTWSGGGGDDNWSTSGNWVGSVPGANSTDVATFNTALPASGKGGAAEPILTSSIVSGGIHSILFDTSAVGAYVFGTTGSIMNIRGNAGSITMNSAVNNTQTFDAAIKLVNGNSNISTTLTNNAESSSAVMLFNGGIQTAASTACTTTITLGGSNTGANTISGLSNAAGYSGKGFFMNKIDAGTWIISGANSMSDTATGTTSTYVNTTISAGTLQFASRVSLYNARQAVWTSANIDVKSGATMAFNVGGTGEFTSDDIGKLSALGSATNGFENGAKLGLDTSNAAGGKFTYSNTIANTNGGSNVIGLVKLGSNSLELTGANTYGGGTTVSGGTLVVNNATGSATGTGNVQVNVGAVLSGAGTIAGAVTIDGSLCPGNSIGKLTVQNDVTWNGGNDWVFELGTSASTLVQAQSGASIEDFLDITGASSDFLKGTGSSWTFDFAGTGDEGWYKLAEWDGVTTFDASDFTVSDLASGLSGSFTIQDNNLYLYVTAVPEPSTSGLIMSALAVSIVTVIRRHRRSWA